MTEPALHVVHSCQVWLNQTETWLSTQVQSLPDGIKSHVVCNHLDNLDQFDRPNLHTIAEQPWLLRKIERGLLRYRLPNLSAVILRVAHRNSARLLHSHYGLVGHQNLLTARVGRLRHIVTFYGKDISLPRDRPRWRARYARLFREVDRVLCEGPAMAESIARLGCPAHKLVVQRLGIRVRDIEYRARSWRAGTPLAVLIAAGFREKKGIPLAIEALARLRRRGVELALTIIGDAVDHPGMLREKARILRALDDAQMKPVTRLLGFQPHGILIDEAYRHHVFLAPSITASDGDSEGGAPISLIEMAATGIAVVSSEHCDIPQVVTHQYSGLLAPERDVDGLVNCLQWLVDDPDRWEPMTRRARAHIESRFDAAAQGEALAQIYREVVESS